MWLGQIGNRTEPLSAYLTNEKMERERQGWQTNLLLTAAIMATVFLALILAQLDALQARVAPQRLGLPIVNIQATAVAVGQIIPLNLDPDAPPPTAAPVLPADDLNPRPEFITGVGEDGVIFTVCGEVPEGWLLYTVQPGETLASLAAGTASTATDLSTANCLADGQLTSGMQILVPRQPTQSLCGPPQWWVRYEVRPGDNLGALAISRGTTVDEVLRANCRDSVDLLAGQLIFLPPGFQPGAAAPLPQPSLTPLPPPTDVPTVVPLPTDAGAFPTSAPPPATDVPPTPTIPVVVSPSPPTATAPAPPTEPPPPDATPTNPPPTDPPPTDIPPTEAPPTDPPPTATPPTLPTAEAVTPDPPPTEAAPTDPPPGASPTP